MKCVWILTLLVLAAGCEKNEPKAQAPEAVPLASVKSSAPDGKALFVAQCVVCHSAVVAGVPKSADNQLDLPGRLAPYEAGALKAYLTQQGKLGESDHPTAMSGSAAEQDALVAWLVALKPAQK